MRLDLLTVLVLTLAFGCGNSDSKETEDTGGNSDLNVEDASDILTQEIGPATELCPHGTVSPGQGCYLPCDNGWHDGAQGVCHMDCPAHTAPDKDGRCTQLDCPEGWSEAPDGKQICVMDCPAGFESDPSWDGHGCRIPCAVGMSRGADGWCHLGCPDGTVPADTPSGCELTAVGERKECPAGKWDIDPDAENPLFIDASSQGADADGTQENPFPTVMEAVAYAMDKGYGTVSFFLGPGDYEENVYIEGLANVTLTGACADNTRIVGEGLGMFEDMALGAVSIIEAESVRISGISVVSDRKGIFVYREKEAGSMLVVNSVRVEDSDSSGLMVLGRYDEFRITDNTILHATSYALGVSNDEGLGGIFPAVLEISGNLIAQMDHCVADFCTDMPYSVGIIALSASKMNIVNNQLVDFDQAQAIFAAYADSVVMRGNLLEELTGSDGIVVDATEVLLEDNRVAGCAAGEFNGEPPGAFRAVAGLTSVTGKPMELTVRRNLLADIQGFGVLVVTADYPNQEASLLAEANEIVASAAGVYYSSGGSMILKGNRFTSNRVAAFQARSEATTMEGNVLRDAVAHDYDLPPGEGKSIIGGNDLFVSLIMVAGEEPVRFSGNHLVNMVRLTDGTGGATVGVGQATSVEVGGNLFEQCWGNLMLMVSSYSNANISDNVFLGVDPSTAEADQPREALLVGAEDLDGETTLNVERNYFSDFMTTGQSSPFALLFEHDEVKVRVADNVMRNMRLAYIMAVGNTVIDSIEVTGNSLHGSLFFLKGGREFLIEDNYLWASIVVLSEVPDGGIASVRRNLFDDVRLEFRLPTGEVFVEDNEFSDVYQLGLVVASAWHPGTTETYPPDVHITHNLFNGVREGEWKWGSVGLIADAMQITGTSEFPCSGVTVTGNRFHDCERSGAILSSAGALVEGNMFAQGCPLVIQNEAEATPVTGSDADFAMRPDSPYGVVTIDDMMLLE